jgi:hypothetical protein
MVRTIFTRNLGYLFDGSGNGLSLRFCQGSVVRSSYHGPSKMMSTRGSGVDDGIALVANTEHEERLSNDISIGVGLAIVICPP